MDTSPLWSFLPYGYLLTILIETPILVALLSARHALGRRLLAGVWLTACTYPVVVLVLPPLLDAHAGRVLYLAVAETFAPAAECALFWAAFGTRGSMGRDFAAIVLANLASFGTGEVLIDLGWLGPLAG